MKKLLIALCLTCALTMAVRAAETNNAAGGKVKPELTAEQKALQKTMLDKYDTNKDGKLSKEERAKMTEEDKARMESAGLSRKKKDPAAPAN